MPNLEILYGKTANQAIETITEVMASLKNLKENLQLQVDATVKQKSTGLQQQDMDDYGRRFHRLSTTLQAVADNCTHAGQMNP